MMKIATFNTNSVRVRLPSLIQWMENQQPDMLCLQEIKVQDKDFPAAAFEEIGYRSVFKGQKTYNGVAILSKLPGEDIRTALYGTDDEEARFVGGRYRDFHLVNVYVPQGFSTDSDKFAYKLQWLEDLLAYIRERFTPADPLLVVGDFNVALDDRDVHDPKHLAGQVGFHPEEQKRLRALLDWGLTDLLRRFHEGGGLYTFWDYRVPNGFKRNIGWRIDYILATPPMAERARKVWIDREARGAGKPSDHTFLVAEFEG